MIIGALLLIALATVPLAGGKLTAIADVRLRLVPLAAAAFAAQILLVNVFPDGAPRLHTLGHLATYAVLAVAVAANLGLPGMPVLALGGLCNAAAIWANGGVMPASADALRTAGMTADPAAFTNSALVAEPRLAFLGDVFATPASWPAANVFSIGDLLLVLGAFLFAHSVCGSRLGRRLPWRRPAVAQPQA